RMERQAVRTFRRPPQRRHAAPAAGTVFACLTPAAGGCPAACRRAQEFHLTGTPALPRRLAGAVTALAVKARPFALTFRAAASYGRSCSRILIRATFSQRPQENRREAAQRRARGTLVSFSIGRPRRSDGSPLTRTRSRCAAGAAARRSSPSR